MGSSRRIAAPWLASVAAHVAVVAGLAALQGGDPAAPPVQVVPAPPPIEVIAPAPEEPLVVDIVVLPPPSAANAHGAASVTPRAAPRHHAPRVATATPPTRVIDAEPDAVPAPEPPTAPAPATAGTPAPPSPPVPPARPDAQQAVLDQPAAAPERHPGSPRLISAVARPLGGHTSAAALADSTFVLILTIDTDGTVIGVEFKRGPVDTRRDRVLAAAWRFRYDPAVDGDGHPIVSRVEQHLVLAEQ